jgi:hypothetical protein
MTWCFQNPRIIDKATTEDIREIAAEVAHTEEVACASLEGGLMVLRRPSDFANMVWQAQHERNIATTRRSVSSRKSSPNSTAAVPIRIEYRAALGALGAGTSSTSLAAIGESRIRGARFDRSRRPLADLRERFTRQALRERPSTPCARVHIPVSPPAARTAARHARASRSSSIFRCFAMRYLREARQAAVGGRRDHPGVADGSRHDDHV